MVILLLTVMTMQVKVVVIDNGDSNDDGTGNSDGDVSGGDDE